MIVVMADDITGAAELGGIGLRYGLQTVLAADVDVSAKPDLLVIYTNTRSMPEQQAVETVEGLTKKSRTVKPLLFYKKTDSVLRGHVTAETKAQMKALGLTKALLVPANPLLGRTIKNGHYYINGQPIHQTGFAADPEFPVLRSGIKEMLNETVNVVSANEQLQDGLSVGEAETAEDLARWAKRQHKDVLLGGGGSFFAALLETRQAAAQMPRTILSRPLLLVSGTAYGKSIERRAAFAHLVSEMPAPLFHSPTAHQRMTEAWAEQTVERLLTDGKAVLAIGRHGGAKADPNLLREKLSQAVAAVLQRAPVHELLIEGGSTAFGVIQKLGFSYFVPTHELSQGVVRMNVTERNDLHLTIKPGSYPWPDEWNFT